MARSNLLIDPPVSAVLPYGLMSVVQPLDVADTHWQAGIAWQSRCPSVAVTYDECVAVTGTAAPPAPPLKTSTVAQENRAATAFTTYVELDCALVGAGDLEQYVRTAYGLVEPYAVEHALWTGQAENNAKVVYPHLAATNQVLDVDGNILQSAIVTGGSFNPANALGFLEAQMASCLGTVGTVHIPRRALPAFSLLLSASGGRLRTTSGNLVAVGSGYTGSAPDGTDAAAGHAWIYGTSQVFGKWSDLRVLGMPGSFDRASNTQKMIVERTYLFGWDCCHVGVLVDLSAVV